MVIGQNFCGAEKAELHMRAVGRAMGAEYGNDICPKKFAFFKEGEMFYRPHYVEVDGVL